MKSIFQRYNCGENSFYPGPNPTNCAFDPSGELGLVITEAGDGKLYRLPLGG